MAENKNYELFTSECFKRVDEEGLDKFINDTTGMDEESVEIYRRVCGALRKIQEKYDDLQASKKRGLSMSQWIEAELDIAAEKMQMTEDQKTQMRNMMKESLEKNNEDELYKMNQHQKRKEENKDTSPQSQPENNKNIITNEGSY